MRDVAAPVLDGAIAASDQIDLTEIVAEGLRRGDECHNRNVATSALLITLLAPAIATTASTREDAAQVLRFAAGNRHFALPFSLCAARARDEAAHGVAGSSVVTAMCGNGRELGVRVSGAGDRWFTGPSPLGSPRLFDGFTHGDACPLVGDSSITETAGFGAAAMTAAPAILSFVGGTPEESRRYVTDMRTICAGESGRLVNPNDGYRGTPFGIDVHLVAEHGIAPVINNGFAHREPGVGQVGAGITRLPIEPFLEASEWLRASAGGGER
jgi:hypothetical protein